MFLFTPTSITDEQNEISAISIYCAEQSVVLGALGLGLELDSPKTLDRTGWRREFG